MSEEAIPCPGCRRAYGAERFARGRTLVCACGSRVGRRLARDLPSGDETRFAADSMLGGLARWLRALGYDTTWEAEIADAGLVRRAVEEGRVIVTRDGGLAAEWWMDGLLLVARDAPLDQLGEVARAFPLSLDRLFTRCTRCNTPLEPVAFDEVPDSIPPAVLAVTGAFSRCPSCRHVYWEGSHTRRMRAEAARALGFGEVRP